MSRRTGELLLHAPFYAMLAGISAGLLLAVEHHPVMGTALIGLSLTAGGFLRAVLSTRAAGMLAIRGRRLDAFGLAGIGLAILFLALSLHNTYRT